MSLAAIQSAAAAAVQRRDDSMQAFRARLGALRSGFEAQTGQSEELPAPYLSSWGLERSEALRSEHGGLLLAIFHFGDHRHIASDLSCLILPMVAPAATHTHFNDLQALARCAPPPFAKALRMTPAKSRWVGRELLAALHCGRSGVVCVDSKLGPDDHLVEEGRQPGLPRVAHSRQERRRADCNQFVTSKRPERQSQRGLQL